jgi:hypothetical protein
VDDDLAVAFGCELFDAAGKVADGDERGSEVDDLVFMRLADVEDEDVFFGVEFCLQGLDGDLWDAVDFGGRTYGLVASDFEWAGLGGLGDSAELVVVDEGGDCGVFAADGAVLVLAELEGAEAHGEGVDQEEPADERLADAEDQLDDFGSLDDADEAGKDAEDAAFGTGGNEARRWWFGV